MLLRVICLTLIIGLIVPALSDCMFDAREAVAGSTELTSYDGKMTFDDQGLTGRNPWTYSVANPNFQEIDPVSGAATGVQLGGSTAAVSNLMFLFPGQWVGSSNWLGGSTKPGYFMTITGTSGSGFIDFWPPIYEFSLRAIADNGGACSMTLQDADQTPFNCYSIPESTVNFNDYRIVRIKSYNKHISRLVFECYRAAVDEIAYKRCGDGYKLIDGDCLDVDECTETPDICDAVANSTCSNLPGGYFCQCNDGFRELDPNVCTDINECQESQPCSDLATCQNTIGSYTCTCKDGYQGNGKGSNGCDDIDECDASPCDPLASCDNTPGSYTCTCPPGYTGDGDGPDSCQDIDECSNLSVCYPDATCTNTNGSFVCTCPYGYIGNGVGINGCNDDDECSWDESPCHPLSTCKNTEGSFTCTCPDGYSGNGIGEEGCQDIDECVFDINPCNNLAVCQNTIGSYNCTCFLGYEGNGEGADGCTDINECESDPCDENASCNNTPGSYSCTCNEGYEGNGLMCTKLNVDPPVFSTPISAPVALGSAPVETPISAPIDAPIGKRPLPQNNSSKIGMSVASSLIMILSVILV